MSKPRFPSGDAFEAHMAQNAEPEKAVPLHVKLAGPPKPADYMNPVDAPTEEHKREWHYVKEWWTTPGLKRWAWRADFCTQWPRCVPDTRLVNDAVIERVYRYGEENDAVLTSDPEGD